jgi:predicted peroxiredoxin
MTTTQTRSDKYLINCQDGAAHPERATISFILAVTASKTAEAAIFMTSDAATLCVKGGADAVVAEGYEPLRDLMSAFVANGGAMWLCPACAKARGITQGDLIEGVEIAGAPRTMAFLAAGGKLLA